MNESPERREEALFRQAIELSTPESRGVFLDQACRDNPALRATLDLLLEGHFAAEGFLTDAPSGTLAHTPLRVDASYRLIEKLGEGGFGEVWLAEQLEPVKRSVAIKILKAGMDTRQVVARFEAERQALALMDHPNIAKVFDAGSTEAGRPYFVMELVRGTKITDYCRQNRLPTSERLQLFILVCQAIQHAHQKGIIHRDIKPSNVLVAQQDPDKSGMPKVIDFGIAKAIEQNLTDKTVVTHFQQLLGTPAYISPEQALITSEDIDTRSDIYSLGVLLYELLVGRPPFDNHELLTAGIDEMRRIIREKEPVRPSTRLCQLVAADPPSKLSTPHSSSLPTDLDWIVMKCLEKDRTRRYETANGLAMDVQRYLNHEPIVARPPSTTYRVAKLVRRNPVVASLISLLILAVTAAMVVGTVLNLRMTRAKNELSKTVLFLESEKMEERAADGLQAQPIAWLAHRLRADPNDWAAATRLISMLSQRSFAIPVFAPLRHDRKVHSAEFSPDGTEIMTASEDGTVRFWDPQNGHALGAMSNFVSVASATYRAGGKRLLVIDHAGVARVYDTSAKSLVFEVPGVHRPSLPCAEGGGGRWLLVEHTNMTISRWDFETGRRLDPLITFTAPIAQRDYSDAGACLAVTSEDSAVHIRDQVTGQPLAPPRIFDKPVYLVSFTPDGRRLFVFLSSAARVAIWNFRDGNEVSEFSVPSPWEVEATRFTPDGRRMLTWKWDTGARVWDLETLKLIGEPISVGVNPTFVLSNSGRIGAAGGQTGNSLVFDVESTQILMEPMQHDGKVFAPSFSADDTRLLTSSLDGTARLWDIRMRRPVRPSFPKPILGGLASFNRAGNRVVVTVDLEAIQVFDAETSRPLSPVLRHGLSERFDIRGAIFSPDDTKLLTVSSQGLLRIWDASSFEPRLDMRAGSDLLLASFSPDGRFIVAGDRGGTASIWSAESGQRLADALHNRNEVLNLDIHPSGRFFVTAALDGLARVWTLPEGKLAMPPLKHRGILWSAIYSPDGERIVTASADKTARIWDSRTGQPLHKPLRHTKDVYRATFSPDSRRVLTTSEDGTARVWNAETGEPVSPLVRHKGAIWHGAFSPDGKIVATGSNSGDVRMWDPETGLPVSETLRIGNRLEFSPDGGRLITFGDQARLWDVIRPPVPAPAWFCELAEAVGGYRQSEDGQLQSAAPDVLKTVRERVTNASAPDFYSRWAKWFLIERMQQAVQPFKTE